MTRKPIRPRPLRPLDAFPDQNWRAWRDHVLTVDIEAIHAAVIAERLDGTLEQLREQGVSLRELAAQAQMSRSGMFNVARCLSYPMEGMIARLGQILAVDLSPLSEVRAVTNLALGRALGAAESHVGTLQARCAELEARSAQLETENAALRGLIVQAIPASAEVARAG